MANCVNSMLVGARLRDGTPMKERERMPPARKEEMVMAVGWRRPAMDIIDVVCRN